MKRSPSLAHLLQRVIYPPWDLVPKQPSQPTTSGAEKRYKDATQRRLDFTSGAEDSLSGTVGTIPA